MKKSLFSVLMVVVLLLSSTSVFTASAAAFKPDESNVVNIFCSFESGDWMPMMQETITSNDQLNVTNFDLAIAGKNAFTGSKSYQASCHSEEGGSATFEWYQVENNKHIYERNGHAELTALYNAGKGLNLTNADYLQFYVKNEANKPLIIKWLSLYGSDRWELKPFAKYVTILRDGEWESMGISDSFITIPRRYEGFIRVELKKENFKSGSWDGTSFDKSLITSVCAYLHADAGGINGSLHIDDMAFVGKNLDIGNKVCSVKKVDEKAYFADFLGTEEEPAATTTTGKNEGAATTTAGKTPTTTAKVEDNKTTAATAGNASTTAQTGADASTTGAEDASTTAAAGDGSTTDAASVGATTTQKAGGDSSDVSKPSSNDQQDNNNTDNGDKSADMTWLIVVIGAVVVAAVVVVVVVVMKKKA